MNESTKNQIIGKLHEVSGSLKEGAGNATNDPDLTAEGQGEKLGGILQTKLGQIQKVFEK